MTVFPCIRVINLNRNIERFRDFILHNGHLGDIERVAAMEGASLDRQALIRSGHIAEELAYLPDALGVAMSHIRLWETAVAENRSLTILEDDILVSHHFCRRASEILASVPDDWAIIQWGHLLNPLFTWVDLGISKAKLVGYGDRRYEDETGQAQFQQDDHPAAPIRLLHAFGLQGYSISAEGARAALAYCLPLRDRFISFPDAGVVTPDSGIDVALCGLYPAVKAYVCLPPLVIHANERRADRTDVESLHALKVSPTVKPSARTVAVFMHPGMKGILDHLAEMLMQGLTESGAEPVLLQNLSQMSEHPLLILGANLLDETQRALVPRHAMILNVENSASPFMTDDYIAFLRRTLVWDYDSRNAANLACILGKPVFYFRMFYVTSLSRLTSAPEADIDVLFFGSFNERRMRILEGLRQRGLVVIAVYDIFAAALDALITRAKVVINIHFYTNGRLEMVRLFDLLANGRAVISELNPEDHVDADLVEAFVGAPYEQLVQATETLVADGHRRHAVAEEGFRAFSRRRAVDILPEAFAWTADQCR